MTSLILGTNQGNIYIYDLPKALENERVINNKKVEMGVEEDLVFTHLNKVCDTEYAEYVQGNGFANKSVMSQH